MRRSSRGASSDVPWPTAALGAVPGSRVGGGVMDSYRKPHKSRRAVLMAAPSRPGATVEGHACLAEWRPSAHDTTTSACRIEAVPVARGVPQFDGPRGGPPALIAGGPDLEEVDRIDAVRQRAIDGRAPVHIGALDLEVHDTAGPLGGHPPRPGRPGPRSGDLPGPGHRSRAPVDVQIQFAADEPVPICVLHVEVAQQVEVIDDRRIRRPGVLREAGEQPSGLRQALETPREVGALSSRTPWVPRAKIDR